MKEKWKFAVAGALSLIMGLSGCGGGSTEQVNLPPEKPLQTYTVYNLDTYLQPFWYTREVYNETVLFVGEDDEAPLLYTPTEILSVRNFGLDTEYRAGEDYTVQDGKIRRLPNSAMPYFTIEEYYRTTPDSVSIAVNKAKLSFTLEGDRYVKYGEGNTFNSKQIAVTYKHASPWNGPIPAGKSEKLAKSLAKLKSGEQTTLLFYGDSITTGCNASGTSQGGNVAPYCPSFPRMVCEYFEEKYAANIEYVNTAVGGWTTEQGQNALDGSVIDYNPDLVFIGFGANNMTTSVASYELMVQDMIERVHAQLPDTEIVLMAGYGPNYETTWYGNQDLFYAALLRLEAEYDFVATANVTEMVNALYAAGKRFRDTTGNNINHPNDFVVRLYAQVILKTMLGKDFCNEIY